MKALTLHQPWAWLVAEGLKQYETRSWATSYRGPLAIHAGKRKPKADECNSAVIHAVGGIYKLQFLTLGAVVCIVDLVECIPTQRLDCIDISTDRAFGDFTPGRWAWRLANVRKIEPVAARGAQGLWEWKQL